MKIKILLVIGVVWAMTSNANAACSIHTWVTDGDNPIYHHTLHCTGYSGAEDADQACVEWVNNFDSSNGSAEYCGTVIIPGEIAWKERGWFRNFDEPRHWFFGKFYYSVCPNNSTFVEGVGCIPFDDQGNQCTAENKGGTSIGNPVNVATGNKFHEETIDVGSDLSIGFAYNSNYPIYRNGSKSINTVAIGWTHEFANTISEVISVNGQNTVFMRRPDGRTIQFNEINGVWTPPIYFKGELTRETSGDWVYQSPDNVIERYASPSIPLLTNNFSRLTSVQDEDGKLLNITYSGPGLEIDRISDNFGSYIEFEYQQFTLYQRAETRITSIRDDENRVWGFTYDSNHNLTDINYPDTTSKTFHYEDSNHPHALTGITDRRGVRFATYEYDTERRVNREWHHAKDLNGIDINVEELSIVYNQDNTRTITNSRGEVSTYEVEQTNGLWQIKSIIGPGCSSCSNDNTDFIYDANNNLISKTRDGVTTEYGGYDSKGQYGYKIEAAGTVDAKRTDYTYDTRFIGKITSVTEDSVYAGNDKVTSYVYNALGQMTSMTVSGYEKDGTAINKTTTYEYNGPFNQISLSDGPIPGTADQTVYQYYPETNPVPERRNRLKRVTGPEGIIDRNHIRWSSTGKVTEEQRPNGITIYNSYDPDTDRLVSVTQTDGAKSVVTQFTYLATGHVESVTSNHGTAEASTLTLTYDDALRVTRVTDELGNYIEYELDTAGNQTGEYTRDPNGVLKKQINQVFDAYDMIDTMTQSGVTVNYDYGSNGVLNQQTNGENIISDYSYDNLKRLTQITQDFQGSGTTANTTTAFTYDAGERVETVTDARGNVTSYEYDDFGNLLKLTSPDTGVTTHTYDLAGNMISKTDANGITVTMAYDGRNRLTSIDYPDNSLDTTYVYDQGTHGEGLLSSFTDQTGNTSFSYDAFGNLISKNQQMTGFSGITYNGFNPLTVSRQYDNFNRLQTLTYPSGVQLTYSYNDLNQIEKIETTVDGQAEVVVDQVTSLPFGPINQINFGNGKHFTANYDNGYRLIDFSYDIDISAVYGYDNNHNITSITRELTNLDDMFSYDNLDRLTNDSHQTTIYGYDKLGNRTSKQVGINIPTSYTIDNNSNRLLHVGNAKARQYDANGNTTAPPDLGSLGMQYNQANRMSKYATKSLPYDVFYYHNGIGQRIRKHKGDNDFVYIYDEQGQLIHESKYGPPEVGFGEDHLWDKEIIWLNNRPVAVIETTYSSPTLTQEIYYIQTDHLNTPRWITDDAGLRIWSWESDAFGTTLPNEDVDGDGTDFEFNLRFPGQYYDNESGFHYNYFRDYEPGTGRYLESDPIGLYGGVNTYGYVNGSPISFEDSFGLRLICVLPTVDPRGNYNPFTNTFSPRPGCDKRIWLPKKPTKCSYWNPATMSWVRRECPEDTEKRDKMLYLEDCNRQKWKCNKDFLDNIVFITISPGPKKITPFEHADNLGKYIECYLNSLPVY